MCPQVRSCIDLSLAHRQVARSTLQELQKKHHGCYPSEHDEGAIQRCSTGNCSDTTQRNCRHHGHRTGEHELLFPWSSVASLAPGEPDGSHHRRTSAGRPCSDPCPHCYGNHGGNNSQIEHDPTTDAKLQVYVPEHHVGKSPLKHVGSGWLAQRAWLQKNPQQSP